MDKQTFDIILLNGRPAAGKSEIIDYLKQVPLNERIQRFHIGAFDEIDDFRAERLYQILVRHPRILEYVVEQGSSYGLRVQLQVRQDQSHVQWVGNIWLPRITLHSSMRLGCPCIRPGKQATVSSLRQI